MKFSGIVTRASIKADKTGSIAVGTTLEISAAEYEALSKLYYNKEDVIIAVVKPEEWQDFLIEEGNKLIDPNLEAY
jgi:hypothetical protein